MFEKFITFLHLHKNVHIQDKLSLSLFHTKGSKCTFQINKYPETDVPNLTHLPSPKGCNSCDMRHHAFSLKSGRLLEQPKSSFPQPVSLGWHATLGSTESRVWKLDSFLAPDQLSSLYWPVKMGPGTTIPQSTVHRFPPTSWLILDPTFFRMHKPKESFSAWVKLGIKAEQVVLVS